MTKQQAQEVDALGADEPTPQTATKAEVPEGGEGDQPAGEPGADPVDLTAEAVQEAALEGQDAEPTVAALQGELDRLKAALAQSNESVLRARADSENIRRRAERDVENAHKFGQEKFASALLPVLDSLELGLSAAQDDQARRSLLQEDREDVRQELEALLHRQARHDPEERRARVVRHPEALIAGFTEP